jgi:hypothetical protein
MDKIALGKIQATRLILGGNPFSGFSHQGSDRDLAMKRYYTTEAIKRTLREAEALGIYTFIGRADHHISRVLYEYWDQGGAIQWFAQTCPEMVNHEASVSRAAAGGAKACYVHGGIMDYLLAQGGLGEIPAVIDLIRQKGMVAGIAGHNPKVFEWAEKNLNVDFYMCSYYNSAHRDQKAEHVSGTAEWFLEEDRRAMTGLIASLSKPVIHYKVMAAGRNDPAEALAYVARHLRPQDAVCVGVFTQGNPGMLREDIEILERALVARKREETA